MELERSQSRTKGKGMENSTSLLPMGKDGKETKVHQEQKVGRRSDSSATNE